MPYQRLRLVVFAFVSSLLSMATQAHDFWLQASEYRPPVGTEIDLSWRVGVGFKGDSLPYITEWIDDFSVVSADGRRSINSVVGNDPTATLRTSGQTMLIGYQSQRSFVELQPEKFNDYLRDEGMEYILQQRAERDEVDRSAPEYFVRCAKALIAGSVDVEPVFGTKLGYYLELLPVADPYALLSGDALDFQLLYLGEPIEGILVQAVSRNNPELRSASRTNRGGRVTLHFAEPSQYLVKAVHMVPLENDPTARWESFWASFTFELK